MKNVIKGFIGIWILILLVSFVSADYTTPIFRYDFELDGNNIPEVVNYDNNATNSGGTTSTNCAFDNCVYFDGTDDAETTNTTIFNGLVNASFSIWFNGTQSGVTQYATRKNDGARNQFSLYGHNNDLKFTISTVNNDNFLTILTGADTDYFDSTLRNMIFVYDGSKVLIYDNGVNIQNSSAVTGALRTVTETLDFGNSGFKGYIDEVCIWDEVLTQSDITSLQTNECKVGGGATNDTTPPSITNVNQRPTNLTILNALTTELNINATITDSEGIVNDSTIFLNVSIPDVRVVIGGVLQDTLISLDYSDKSGDIYMWDIHENYYLSHVGELDHEEFENNPLLNDTLTSNSQYIAQMFRNVTNNNDLMFTEIMDDNSTEISQYFLCNSNYTFSPSGGNPLSSEWCQEFYVQTGNDIVHVHDNGRFHRLLTMGVNSTSGMLGNVYVTETVYVLKRGSNNPERYYYIANDTDSTWKTTNNANSWSDYSGTGTLNMHLHELDENDTFSYQVCASDNASNKACSSFVDELVDFVSLPPAVVNIDVPVQLQSYNDSITIEHSRSFSFTGATIVNYTYEYRQNTSASWTEIGVNQHPDTEEVWNIENRANGGYFLRITTSDSNGLTSVAISEFIIANEESLNTQLLTSIDDTLENIEGGIMDIAFIILYVGMFAITTWLLLKNKSNIGLWHLFLMLGLDLMLINILYNQYWTTIQGTSTIASYMAYGSFVLFMLLPIYRLWSIISVLMTKITRS